MKLEVSDELKQQQALTNALVGKILCSKRLLVDHVDALQQCLQYLQSDVAAGGDNIKNLSCNQTSSTNKDIFSTRNACMLFGGTLLQTFVSPRSLRLLLLPSLIVSSGFGAIYMLKQMFLFRNKLMEHQLDNLITTIDDFGNCIRRNMAYFNEIVQMKQRDMIETLQIERAWDCITSAKEVTEILYEATRKLEEQYPLPAKFKQYYAPMEELRECEYFKNNITNYSPNHIKYFHNIFAYVQSQYLLRLALIIITKPSIGALNGELSKTNSLIRQLVQEEERHFKNLAIELNEKKQLEAAQLHVLKAESMRSGPVAVLQDCSLKLSARMVAVAGACHNLDITLQRLNVAQTQCKGSTKNLLTVAQNMRDIENSLSVCFDDFQRLMLVYNKFLCSRLEALNVVQTSTDQALSNEESILRVEITNSQLQTELNTQNSDDFFAYAYDEKQTQQQQQHSTPADDANAHENALLNFEERITKGKFKPVLQQLKSRIGPIRQAMLEKEREVLAFKGINVDEFLTEKEKQAEKFSLTDSKKEAELSEQESDDSADIEHEKRQKELRKIKQDQFNEMREFLARKQAINLMKLDLPHTNLPAITGPEDLVESEC